jgi:hypothetical protein
MVVGVTVNATMVGGEVGAGVTITVTEAGPALPPVPVQLRVKVTVPTVVRAPELVPALEVGCGTAQLFVPPAPVHEFALLLVQASDTDCPTWTTCGVAVKEVTAAALGELLTVKMTDAGMLVPPAPLQVNV